MSKIKVVKSRLFPGVWYAERKHASTRNLEGYSFKSWDEAISYAVKWAYGKLL